MDKVQKWKSEIIDLNKRIDLDENEISNHYGSIKSEYAKVKDMTVDSITTDKAIKEIRSLEEKIAKCESSVKSARKSISRREENIELENKIQSRKL